MPLDVHELSAVFSELKARCRVDGIVNTAMAGVKTAQKGAVGGVDNGIGSQTGDISLPEGKLRVVGQGWEALSCHNPFGVPLCGEYLVLEG